MSQPPTQVTQTHPANAEEFTHNEVTHFRQAFAIVGTLIAQGLIPVDFEARGWEDGFQYMIYQVAGVLNVLEPD